MYQELLRQFEMHNGFKCADRFGEELLDIAKTLHNAARLQRV